MNCISHRRLKHMAAAQHPETSRQLAALREDWHRLSPAERGRQVRELLGRGCTVRGLARDLGVTESALRYDLKAAGRLPAGPGKPGQTRPTPRRPVVPGPKPSDKARGEEATRRILAWLDAELPGLSAAYREQLLDEARRILWSAERVASIEPATTQAARRQVSYRQVIEQCRPAAGEDEVWLSVNARWLARWLWHLYPDPEVRDEALKKVERSPVPEKPRPAGRR